MPATIAVTGASGFVGRRTAEVLVASGARVRALVRDPAKLSPSARVSMELVQSDLFDEGALARLVDGAETVVHCAGELANPALFEAVNVEGTRHLIAVASRERVARFVHVSSLAAREPRLSAYGESKRAGEEIVRAASGNLAMVVRPPAVYGPGDRATFPLIAQLKRGRAFLPGTPRQRFSLIHVDDLAHALVALAFAPPLSTGIHELDDGRTDGYSWSELASIAGEVEGKDVQVTHLPRSLMTVAAKGATLWAGLAGGAPRLTMGKVAELYHPDWVCRNDLLHRVSDWKPRVGFAEGFAMTVDWYRRNGWLPASPKRMEAPARANEGNRAG